MITDTPNIDTHVIYDGLNDSINSSNIAIKIVYDTPIMSTQYVQQVNISHLNSQTVQQLELYSNYNTNGLLSGGTYINDADTTCESTVDLYHNDVHIERQTTNDGKYKFTRLNVNTSYSLYALPTSGAYNAKVISDLVPIDDNINYNFKFYASYSSDYITSTERYIYTSVFDTKGELIYTLDAPPNGVTVSQTGVITVNVPTPGAYNFNVNCICTELKLTKSINININVYDYLYRLSLASPNTLIDSTNTAWTIDGTSTINDDNVYLINSYMSRNMPPELPILTRNFNIVVEFEFLELTTSIEGGIFSHYENRAGMSSGFAVYSKSTASGNELTIDYKDIVKGVYMHQVMTGFTMTTGVKYRLEINRVGVNFEITLNNLQSSFAYEKVADFQNTSRLILGGFDNVASGTVINKTKTKIYSFQYTIPKS